MHTLRRLLLGLSLSVGIFLFAGELLTRLYLRSHTVYDVEMARYANELKLDSPNPRIGHLHRPNSQAHLMNVDVRINSQGMRDRERSLEKGAAERIAFLGDSLTFGWGVEQSNTFATLLERRLSAVRPTEILNFGTGNYNTEQEVNQFLEQGFRFHPDRVVVFYFINDAEVTPQKSKLWFLGLSRLFTMYWSRVLALRSAFTPGMSFQSYYSALYQADQPGWINTQKAFLDLQAACASRGLPLQVVVLPELHNVVDYTFKREHALLTTFLTQHGIANLDLAPAFKWYSTPMDLWVATDDAHPNAKAHAMIADYAFDFLKAKEKP